MAVAVKRVYDPPSASDGKRVLVDRLWPRGLSREAAKVDEWLKDVAPSNELRRWYHVHRDRWSEFRSRYLEELRSPEAAAALDQLYALRKSRGTLTLLFASKDLQHNNAVVLKDLLEGMRKPPRGTGAGAAKATGRRAAAARRR